MSKVTFNKDANFYDEAVKLWVRQIALAKLQEFAGSKKEVDDFLEELNQELIARLKPLAQEAFSKLSSQVVEQMKKTKVELFEEIRSGRNN